MNTQEMKSWKTAIFGMPPTITPGGRLKKPAEYASPILGPSSEIRRHQNIAN